MIVFAPAIGRRAWPSARSACSGEAAPSALSRSRCAASEGSGPAGTGSGPAEEDGVVDRVPDRGQVVREVEVQAEVGVVGEDGHAVAGSQRVEEGPRLVEAAHQAAQARALEVLLEEEHDETAVRAHRSRGGRDGRGRPRLSAGPSATHTTESRATGRSSTRSRKSCGSSPASGPAARADHPGLQHHARGADSREPVRGLLRRPRRGHRCRGQRERCEAQCEGHRPDASTRPSRLPPVLA